MLWHESVCGGSRRCSLSLSGYGGPEVWCYDMRVSVEAAEGVLSLSLRVPRPQGVMLWHESVCGGSTRCSLSLRVGGPEVWCYGIRVSVEAAQDVLSLSLSLSGYWGPEVWCYGIRVSVEAAEDVLSLSQGRRPRGVMLWHQSVCGGSRRWEDEQSTPQMSNTVTITPQMLVTSLQ